MVQGYVRDPELGLLVRRPGAIDLAWMRRCFGPFRLSGHAWEIGHGGGFWCQEGDRAVRMRGSRSGVTELRTTRDVPLRGAIEATLPVTKGSFEVVLDAGDRQSSIRLAMRPDGSYDVYRTDRNGRTASSHVLREPGEPIRVVFGSAARRGDVVVASDLARARLLLRTDAGPGTRFVFDLDR
jgi:hypothetical protein